MLWRIPADLHDQRIGDMPPTQAFSAHPRPVTSVSATKVSPWLPATLIGVSLAEIAEIPTRRRAGGLVTATNTSTVNILGTWAAAR
jgi:hypothetical protein